MLAKTFIEVPMLTKKWKELGLTDENLRDLENVLLENLKAGQYYSRNRRSQKNPHPFRKHRQARWRQSSLRGY